MEPPHVGCYGRRLKTGMLRHIPLLLAMMFLALGVQLAEGQQTRRFLFIFETSPTIKKNLPVVKNALAKMFENNLQGELHLDDEIAVWTVDEDVHYDPKLLGGWSPESAATYAKQLDEHLDDQHYTRHASLNAIQPALSRVVKNSERLTVLIFCDTQSHMAGTPDDNGINQAITNTAAKVKAPIPLVIVLRSYRGEYVGSSVNHSADLDIPPFPLPPKSTPPPTPTVSRLVTPPAPAPAQVSGPVVTPVPALIIVGTKAGTNISLLTNTPPPSPPPPPPAPAPVIKNPPTSEPATNTTTSMAPPPPPASTEVPQPAPLAPPTVVVTKPAVVPPPATAQSNTTSAATGNGHSNGGYLFPLAIGIGALASALVIVARLMLRARRPQSSLISSSMLDDRHQPPK